MVPRHPFFALMLLVCGSPYAVSAADESQIVITGSEPSERAPHGLGNVYAPEVHRDGDHWRMWYGGQGMDGHDRIHYAESVDGMQWTKRGVVVDSGSANHVNDPTVVRVGDTWWMFYTLAMQGELDEIAAATSRDGIHWTPRGVVLGRGVAASWDAGKVGRPSATYSGERFRLWYDGQPGPPTVADASMTREVRQAGRAVGYAESMDGVTWTRHPTPIVPGVGAVHVLSIDGEWRMVYESTNGTHWATSPDGLQWTKRGIIAKAVGDLEASGHVTPFLLGDHDGGRAMLYYGAAERPTWNFNRIARRPLEFPQR